MSRSSDWNSDYGDMGLVNQPRLMQLPLTVLDPWVDATGKPQPFKPYTDSKMQDLVENIRDNGIIEPIRVRPRPGGRFQILAGHNRCKAARMVGLITVPALVEDVDDDKAAIMLVDSNLQHRETLLPSEKAFAYKLRMEKMKKKAGRPSKENQSQVATDLGSNNNQSQPATDYTKSDTASVIGAVAHDSRDQVFRYIRLTYLIPSLLDKVDAGTIGVTVGVDLSYLAHDAQAMLARIMEQHSIKRIKGGQASELRQLGTPTEQAILRVLGITEEEKASIPSLSVKPDLSAYGASMVRLLKKNEDYLTGLQLAVQAFTDKFIQDRKLND